MTRAQIEAARARYQLGQGSEELRSASRFGRAGLLARAALFRLTKSLAVRESLMDERLVVGLEALAIDTSVSHRGVSSFPDPLSSQLLSDVAAVGGRLYMHATDAVMTPFIREHGIWEADETAFIESVLRPGSTFVDVGANIGYFSVLASALVGPEGRVFAVEPEQRNVALLRANLWRNQCGNAVVLPVAAYRERGFLPLRLNEENRGDHQIGWENAASALVPCARLDDLLTGVPVDFVKIDTQGVDHDVIAGLSGLVDEHPSLTVMCEFWLEGMAERQIDPHEVATGYERLGFDLALLGEGGALRRASPGDVVAAAGSEPGQYVNVVLRRPS